MERTDTSKIYNYHGWQTYIDADRGYYPYFSNTIQERLNQKKVNNIVVVGEPGDGKSYLGTDICRIIEGYGNFSIDQVVFTYSDYMDLVLHLEPRKPICFDEPSFAMGKRTWFDELQRALVLTIESQRFKQHPLIIPICNADLLDKTIRTHLIQFKVVVHDRGKATVYRTHSSQFDEKFYHSFLCDLDYDLFDNDICDKDSCLDCELLNVQCDGDYVCQVFRARYERKKASVQEHRYEQARELSQKTEAKSLTIEQLENLCYSIKDTFIIDGKVNVNKLMMAMQEKYGIQLSNTKAYNIRAMLLEHHAEILKAV